MDSDPKNRPSNKLAIYSCIVLNSLALAILFLTHSWWALLFSIPASLFLSKNKPASKKEQEELEEVGAKAFAAWLLLPAGIMLLLIFALILVKVIPSMMK
ncbi:MAG: hypothetical protein WAW37_15455 [Syntrophobacteraceae bacterium]